MNYEYKVLYPSKPGLESTLNYWAKYGWEICLLSQADTIFMLVLRRFDTDVPPTNPV